MVETRSLSRAVKPLVNEHGSVHWLIGVITAVNATAKTVSVQFAGAAAGQSTSGVAYLSNYTPVVGHKVHALSSEVRGVIVIGAAGTGPVGLMAAPELADEVELFTVQEPDAVSDRSRSGTLVQHSDGSIEAVPDLVQQGFGKLGAWQFPGLVEALGTAQSNGLVTSFEIEVIRLSGIAYPAFILLDVSGSVPVIATDIFRSRPVRSSVPTKVALPLGWVDLLQTPGMLIGLSNSATVRDAAFSAVSAIYLTVSV